MKPFDVLGDLPEGTTLLEASAGTGKTWTIAALVVRYVAERDVPLEQMLVVTFTRAASQELRDRVRQRLLEAARTTGAALEAQDSGGAPPDPGDDVLLRHLLACPPAELRERHDRLRRAVAGFDAATIATIHQFCQQVLRGLGVAGDSDPDAVLVEELDDLVEEVVDDLWLAGALASEETPAFDRAEALRIARTVVGDPRARVEPRGLLETDPTSGAARRVAFADAVRAELDRRKRLLGVLGYDDLLGQLADALADPASPARRRMRQRWQVVLVDEFQDTDPVQWQVFERAFAEDPGPGAAPDGERPTLVLIGDPKQAIYAFRGGDVATYLRAAERATTRATLATNHRSDGPLVAAVQAVLRGAALGDARIAVHDVDAAHRGARLRERSEPDGPWRDAVPFRMRVVRHDEVGARGPRSKVSVDRWREHVVDDLARQVKDLLLRADAGLVEICDGPLGAGDVEPAWRPLRPADVAVLAEKRKVLHAVQEALGALGVPSVVAAGGSVFRTPAATEWLTLLEALEQPHRADRVRAAALTAFLGHDVVSLDAGGDDLTDQLAERVRGWSEVLAARGVAAVLELAVADGLTARVLRTTGGARRLTDLRHVGEALHRVAVEQRLGAAGLLGWLRDQVAEDDRAEVAGERTRRLDSDAAAVQLSTVHGAKGLEYGVVLLPTLWDRWIPKEEDFPRWHDDEGRRCLHVGGRGVHRRDAEMAARADDDGESLRLLYVALTRARSQVVAWWAPHSFNSPSSALNRVLRGRRPGDAAVPVAAESAPDDALLPAVLSGWAAAGGPVAEPARPVEVSSAPLPAATTPLDVRRWTRTIDQAWRRTSYSSLAAAGAAHGTGHALVTTEPEAVPGLEDEPEALGEVAADVAGGVGGGPADAVLADDGRPLTSVTSPMADLPVGATFGSLVHAVLEHADPDDPDLPASLAALVEEHRVWWPVDVDADALVAALLAVLDTPLGPLAGGRPLRGVPLRDRLAEMDFELPLSGGDHPSYARAPGRGRDVVLGDLAPLLRAHLLEGDPVRAFADALDADRQLADQPLRGYLTGSIDVVLRVPVEGQVRYLTVDYKTNRLGGEDGVLTAHDYRPAVLDRAMAGSDYPLQALLYTVVLHRWLRGRLPGYDPEQHLGGVLYLYLRGMTGADVPTLDGAPCGVFAWRPPVALVEGLSALLDGRPLDPAAGTTGAGGAA